MNAQDADANAYPDMAVWHPDQMAYDALQDCGNMLKAAKDGSDQSNYDRQRAFRKALRAAHDAMHCSLVCLLYVELYEKTGAPYSNGEKHLEFTKNHSGIPIEFAPESRELYKVKSTRGLLSVARKELECRFPLRQPMPMGRHMIQSTG